MKERIPQFERTPSFPEEVIDYAYKTRVAPNEWLTAVAEHLKKGDITEEGLCWFVECWSIAAKDVVQRILTDFPKATNLFTYMDIQTTFWVLSTFDHQWLERSWPDQLSLEGMEINAHKTYALFSKIDLTSARISFVTTRSGERISLLDDRLEDSPVQWGLGKAKVGVCPDAEEYFQLLFERTSSFDRNIPFDGVLFTDRGSTIACLKFDGVESMAALRTVIDTEGKTQMHKGVIYALGSELYKKIVEQAKRIDASHHGSHLYDRSFLTIDIADLEKYCNEHEIPFEKNGMRFLGERSVETMDQPEENLYERMTLFAKKADAGGVTTFPLFPASPADRYDAQSTPDL